MPICNFEATTEARSGARLADSPVTVQNGALNTADRDAGHIAVAVAAELRMAREPLRRARETLRTVYLGTAAARTLPLDTVPGGTVPEGTAGSPAAAVRIAASAVTGRRIRFAAY